MASSTNRLVAAEALEVQVTKIDEGARVTVDGQLFAEYRIESGTRPAVWPIVGPTGQKMTRGYPMVPPGDDEATDHPHHRSLWFGHEGVAETNTWTEPGKGQSLSGTFGRQVHREFTRLENDGPWAIIAATNDWVDAAGKKVCEDQRTLRFAADEATRTIDFAIRLIATEEDVPIEDTKEGTFAIRVAETMKVDAKLGGKIVTSRGLTDEAAWGMPAEWVDYIGPVAGETVGIAILSHPSNFRPAPRWHVRTYGLFAANPFGERDFPPVDGYKQSAITIRHGEELQLRYRVIMHKGDHKQSNLAALYEAFAAE